MNARRLIVVPALVLACRGPGLEPDDFADLGARVSVWMPDSASVLARVYNGIGLTYHAYACDSATYRNLWDDATDGLLPAPSLPPVDLHASAVIVAVKNGGAVSDARLDSVVVHAGGAAAFVTTCSGYSPLQVGGVAQEFVQAPRYHTLRFHTHDRDECW